MTDAIKSRCSRLGTLMALACVLTLLLMPRMGHARAATMEPTGLHFSGLVLHGPDAGVQIDGFLALTPGTGTQMSGTLSTFAGSLMGRLGSYTPIAVTGTMSQMSVTLSFDLSSVAQQSASMGIPALQKLALPQFRHLGAHAMLQVTGRSFADGTYGGSLSGPAAGDSGSWTATMGVNHSFDFSASAKTGPAWSISGQAAVVFGADGSISGLYISDDHKKVYPVRGVVGNNWMSLILTLGNNQVLYGSGSAGNIDTYQFFTGTFYGPAATTSGKWSAALTS